MKVTLAGKELDLSQVLPLKLRDWKNLEKMGLNPKRLEEGSMADTSILVFYVCNKADATVTQDMVDDLSLDDPELVRVINAIGGKDGTKLDRPSSTSSTPSPAPTDGQ